MPWRRKAGLGSHPRAKSDEEDRWGVGSGALYPQAQDRLIRTCLLPPSQYHPAGVGGGQRSCLRCWARPLLRCPRPPQTTGVSHRGGPLRLLYTALNAILPRCLCQRDAHMPLKRTAPGLCRGVGRGAGSSGTSPGCLVPWGLSLDPPAPLEVGGVPRQVLCPHVALGAASLAWNLAHTRAPLICGPPLAEMGA